MDKFDDKILIEALDALEAGDLPDEILARYPAEAEQLRPLLELTTELANRPLEPTTWTQRQSRQAFLNTAEEMGPPVSSRIFSWWPIPRQALTFVSSMALVMIIIFSGIVTNAAAQRAVPGSSLYAIKRWGENLRLQLTREENRSLLEQQFAAERLVEINRLLLSGDQAGVSFTGQIEAMSDNSWMIAGIPVIVTSQTALTPGLMVSELVEVRGEVNNRQLIAAAIQRLPNSLPLPTPTETPTPTATETPTAASTPTSTIEPTTSPTAPPTEEAAAPSPAATAEITLPPTITAPVNTPQPSPQPENSNENSGGNDDDDDDNSGSNDNDNDNDDDDGSNDNDNDDNSGSNDNDDDDDDNSGSNDNDDDDDDNSGSNDNDDDDDDNSGSNDNDDDDDDNSGSGSGDDGGN